MGRNKKITEDGIWMPLAIAFDKNLTGQERVMLSIIIYFHRYGTDGGCHLSDRGFIKRYGIPKGSVSRLLRSLEEKKCISREKIWEKGRITGRMITPTYHQDDTTPPTIKMIPPLPSGRYPNKEENKEYKETYKEKPVCIDKPKVGNKKLSIISTEPKAENNAKSQAVSPADFMAYWNAHKSLPEIHTFSNGRKRALAIRSKEPVFVDNWKRVIDKLSNSPFHVGQNNRKWRADVDWILGNDTNYVRILEQAEPEFGSRDWPEDELWMIDEWMGWGKNKKTGSEKQELGQETGKSVDIEPKTRKGIG